MESLPDGTQVERPFAWEIGNAETATDVEDANRRRRMLGEAQREFDRLLLRLADRFGSQVLRAAVDVKSFESKVKLCDLPQQVGHGFGIDTELLGAASHLHARRFQLKVRVDSNRDPRGQGEAVSDPCRALRLME